MQTLTSPKSIVVVGAGKMGGAIIEGWLKQGVDPASIYVLDRNEDALGYYSGRGLNTFRDVADFPVGMSFEVFLLALKPQVIVQNLSEFNALISESTCLISVAAGVTCQSIQSMLPAVKQVVRVMPNTPSMIGKGVMVGYSDQKAQIESLTESLFQALGKFYWVEDETQMHAVTAISGSGPAYLFYFAECLVDAAQSFDLKPELAKALALETMIGASCLVESSSDEVSTLRENVTSPNGTTQAGLEALMDGEQFKEKVFACLKAAANRSVELS
ncbi:pyrroline-5-carboxylate reductase [Marinomonas ostreistagni]|uniref:Pyrroline-5-carboxylate reductase n=1 Tax=Marinomonas ostreistagni TaxID=359209 RepID=A0ABS0ZG60_9GAMM|nr:pyrroline-5-carboxylate reductase [Marinomonas ostreistagni]MBJ7552660.1 pyrroline-5-carboxylate reductase [Marinomonas ostreistagni]